MAGSSGSGPVPTPPKAAPPKPAPPKPAPTAPAPSAAPLSTGDDWRIRLHAALVAQGLSHTADAIEHSELKFSGSELLITTTRMYTIALKNDAGLQQTVQQLAGRPVKITLKQGEPAPAGRLDAPVPPPPGGDEEEEARRRALGHPEVQRFTETFPDAHVRTIRNLKP